MASQLGGALPPPRGVEPNFINPDSLETSNLVQHATCLTLVTGFVIMRFYTRVAILKARLGVDDYFCVLSYALDWAYAMLMVTAYSKGLGRHMWDLPAADVPEALKYLTLAAWVYMILTCCIKLTFLFCYQRIFSTPSRVRTFVNIGIAFIIALTTGLFFATIFSCVPVQRSWNAALPGTCFNPLILPWFSAASSALTDLYILVLPIVPLWRLNMGFKNKLKVMIAFSFGSIACIASLVRLGMTHVLQSNPDVSWNTASIGRWSGIEVDVGLICSCLILLPAFLKYHLPESFKAHVSRYLSMVSDKWTTRFTTPSKAANSSGNPWPLNGYEFITEAKFGTSTVETYSVGPEGGSIALTQMSSAHQSINCSANIKSTRI